MTFLSQVDARPRLGVHEMPGNISLSICRVCIDLIDIILYLSLVNHK